MSTVNTNILVRYYIQDDKEQFEKAAVQNPIFINHIVLSEWVRVLSRAYKIEKEHIVRELEIMLDSKEVELEKKETIRNAIHEYKHSNADFSDCLINSKNKASAKHPTYTFDKEAAKLKGMKLLK